MSVYIPSSANLSEAWLRTIEHVVDAGGHAVNVVSTIENPLQAESPEVRAAVDAVVDEGDRKDVRIQSVSTVAGTLFPRDLYADTGLIYTPGMDPEELGKLDASAEDLYDSYTQMLPYLTTDRANNRGTYFGRMISWPGKTAGGTNQLAERITRLRRDLDANKGQRNLEDIAVGGEAEMIGEPAGLQIYSAGDRRHRGFPCLVHVDLTLYRGHLSMAATYRHQYLVTKGYGNLLGLSHLLDFLAKQSGFQVGELMVNATFADAEYGTYSKRGVAELIARAREGIV